METPTEKSYRRNFTNSEFLFVPKVIYGIDDRGSYFIYFKLKELKQTKFDNEVFIVLFQDDKKYRNHIVDRQNKIIKMINSKYTISDVRSEGTKSSFFIKKKLFDDKDQFRGFYSNTIKNIAKGIKSNFDRNLFKMDNLEISITPGILNWKK